MIGPRQYQALRYLASFGPLNSKYELARHVGPHGSNQYGDRTVWRCIHAGYIGYSQHPTTGRYTLWLTEKGREALK